MCGVFRQLCEDDEHLFRTGGHLLDMKQQGVGRENNCAVMADNCADSPHSCAEWLNNCAENSDNCFR